MYQKILCKNKATLFVVFLSITCHHFNFKQDLFRVRVMVFNNISVISWRSVLLEKTTDLLQVMDKTL